MKDYCTCGFRRIEQTFLGDGIVFCSDCRQPLCCDVAHLDPTVEPHPVAIADENHATCWRHWNGVEATALSHSFSKQ